MSRKSIKTFWAKGVAALALVMILTSSITGAFAYANGIDSVGASQSSTGRILGVQRALGGVTAAPTNNPCTGNCKLSYHGGLVEQASNKVYAIYWIPSGYSVSTNYVSLINRYFGDVAHDSGKATNVYDSDTQYTDSAGNIVYNSTFAGSVTDTNALPASGCSDAPMTVCVTDAQLQTEIGNVVAAQGWTANATTEFFMFTAKGVGSCFDSTSTTCSFSYYCAYHSWTGTGTSAMLYANMPYADSVTTGNCDVGQHPNSDDADATINVTSHEHNETITDEQGNAWYNTRTGSENGDECAWYFGAVKGTSGKEYTQAINGNHYWMQLEWSNKDNKCAQHGV